MAAQPKFNSGSAATANLATVATSAGPRKSLSVNARLTTSDFNLRDSATGPPADASNPRGVRFRASSRDSGNSILTSPPTMAKNSFGLRTTVVVQVTLKGQSEADLSEFEQAVALCDSVLRCFLMSGSDDYLLILLVRDLVDFERVHKTQLSRLPHVARIQSSFALRDVVRRALPADLLRE